MTKTMEQIVIFITGWYKFGSENGVPSNALDEYLMYFPYETCYSSVFVFLRFHFQTQISIPDIPAEEMIIPELVSWNRAAFCDQKPPEPPDFPKKDESSLNFQRYPLAMTNIAIENGHL